MADSDFKEQGEHVMGFFKQKGPLQRDFCEVLLYVVALWALKPASLQDILTVNQCDGMWFFSAAFFAIVFVGIVSDYLLITIISLHGKQYTAMSIKQHFRNFRNLRCAKIKKLLLSQSWQVVF